MGELMNIFDTSCPMKNEVGCFVTKLFTSFDTFCDVTKSSCRDLREDLVEKVLEDNIMCNS